MASCAGESSAAAAHQEGRAQQNFRVVDLSDPEELRARKVSANRILGQLKAALNYAVAEDKVLDDREWKRIKPFRKLVRPL